MSQFRSSFLGNLRALQKRIAAQRTIVLRASRQNVQISTGLELPLRERHDGMSFESVNCILECLSVLVVQIVNSAVDLVLHSFWAVVPGWTPLRVPGSYP